MAWWNRSVGFKQGNLQCDCISAKCLDRIRFLRGNYSFRDPFINVFGGSLGVLVGTDLFTWGKKVIKVSSIQDLNSAIGREQGNIWGIVMFGHGDPGSMNGPIYGNSKWASGDGSSVYGVDFIEQSDIIAGLSAQGFSLSKSYAMQCYSFDNGGEAQWKNISLRATGYFGLNVMGVDTK